MRIGIVSLWWPPHFGGGEVYACRLAVALQRSGIAVDVITTSAALPDRDNGGIAALRCGAPHDPRSMKAFRQYLQGPEHAAWCAAVAAWAAERRFTHILCNAPLTRPGFSPAAPALFDALRATGAQIGAIHHDLGPRTLSSIVSGYAECGDWERTADRVATQQRAKALARGAQAFHDAAASPLYFAPAFVVGCSHWSTRFIDPLDEVPKFVLHPLQTPDVEAVAAPGAALPPVTVAMLNPLPQKGARNMADVILHNRRDWTFRVLQGGWGDAFAGFAPMIEEAPSGHQGQVALLPYVSDIRAFYRAAAVFMFPSRQEGYGMAPVEAMQAGTPVAATDYPAIREAVGDGARIVPYFADGREWIDALAEVLEARDDWRARAAARVRTLAVREAEELPALIAFLRALPGAPAGTGQPGAGQGDAGTSAAKARS